MNKKRITLTQTEMRIVTEALKLSAKEGFDAVTMDMIAEAVGIKAPSLYKHFRNKQDIFESILIEMKLRDAKNAKESGLPLEPLDEEDEDEMSEYARVDIPAFLDYCRKMFRYWTGDEFASSFRKMLTVEQYKNQEMSELYHQYLGTGPLGYTADIIGSEKAALALYGPMYMLYSIFDEAESKYTPGFENTIYEMLDDHLNNWYAEYGGRN